MRKNVKIMCLVLAIVLLVGLMPVSAANATEKQEKSAARYTVLILDISGSMSGTPENAQREAAKKFCEAMLSSGGENYIAIVELGSSSYVLADFTDDLETLETKISRIGAYSGTNTNAALERAGKLLSSVPENSIRNIVLCSDGMPESGNSITDGRYSEEDSPYYYSYANAAYETASKLRDTCTIYTLGFFHSLSGEELEFAQRFMRDLANAVGNFHSVTDPEELQFEFGNVADDITKEVRDVQFQFSGHIKHEDVASVCHYSDSFFNGDARDLSIPLATMSLCFELTTWSRYDDKAKWSKNPDEENPKFKNARDLLIGENGIGFDSFAVSDGWASAPERDTIGVVAARKTIGDSTLIALGIRGGGYEQEWCSNFTVGSSGDHIGFSEARDEVLGFLNKYVRDNSIQGNVKLWIVGYSRGGVVANMTAGKLTEDLSLSNNITLSPKDIYAYTFETPKGTLQENMKKSYTNIHNFVNLNDFVSLVAMQDWGFSRYNYKNDYYFPTAYTDLSAYQSMISSVKQNFAEFGGTYSIPNYSTQYRIHCDPTKILPKGDPFVWTEPYQVSRFDALTTSVSTIADDVLKSRTYYYDTLQSLVREATAKVLGGKLLDSNSETLTLDAFVDNIVSQLSFARLMEIYHPLVALNFDSYETRERKVRANMISFVGQALEGSDYLGATADILALRNTLSEILMEVFTFAWKDLVNNQLTAIQSVYNMTQTLEEIGQAHYPELCLSWMNTLYEMYQNNHEVRNEKGFRIIHINCPVDVHVFNTDTGDEVAAIVDDSQVEIENGAVSYVDLDDEKIICLPRMDNYRVEITAREECNINYAVNEYSIGEAANTRIVNYLKVHAGSGDNIVGIIPAISDEEQQEAFETGSSVAYRLLGVNGEELNPKEDLKGSAAIKATYNVTVSAENENAFVNGGGVYPQGNFAMVEASPLSGYVFDGWYEGNKMVSEEPIYRFEVEKDTDLVAHFKKEKTYKATFEVEGNGTVENIDVYVAAGTEINVIANPDKNGKFLRWTATSGKFENNSAQDTWFTMPAEDVTIAATFQKTDSSNSSTVSAKRYDVVTEETEHGKVTVSETKAEKGHSISVLPKPDKGFEVSAVSILDADGNELTAEVSKDGTYQFTMPASDVIVKVVFRETGKDEEHDCPSAIFKDIDISKWYHEAVDYVLKKGYMVGISSDRFHPNGTVTRAQIVQIMYAMEGKPTTSEESSFTDVKKGKWYYDAVNWAASNDLVAGYGNGCFGPENMLTREQMVTILYRYAQFKGYDITEAGSLSGYNDASSVSNYAKTAMRWAIGHHIVSGTEKGLEPKGTATRAQIAVMMKAFDENIVK